MIKKLHIKSMVAGAFAAISLIGLGAFTTHSVGASYIQDCTTNSVIQCGAPDAASFVKKIKASDKKDLNTIYSAFGLTQSQYDDFVANAKPGTAYKNGTVKVGDKVVINDAWSLGRERKSYDNPLKIGNTTYSTSYLKDVMENDSLPVMVMFNDQGVAQFVVMNACGNPVWGNKVIPKYSCDSLQKTPVSGKPNSFVFSTKATALNNAAISKVVYNFGDGTTQTETNPATKVTHTYAKPGNYTAKVTVYVGLPGGATTTAPVVADCQTQVTVPQPIQQCLALTSKVISVQDRTYQYIVTTKQNGSTLTGASFTWGDNSEISTVKATTATTVVTKHQFEKAGNYTTTATVSFNTPYGLATATCQTSITIAPDMCPIKPDVTKDSPECVPCEYNKDLPKNSEACKAPETPPIVTTSSPVLPATGAGGVVGLFAGTSIFGGLGYSFFKRRKN